MMKTQQKEEYILLKYNCTVYLTLTLSAVV